MELLMKPDDDEEGGCCCCCCSQTDDVTRFGAVPLLSDRTVTCSEKCVDLCDVDDDVIDDEVTALCTFPADDDDDGEDAD